LDWRRLQLVGSHFLPQMLKVLKTKSTKDNSREMILLLACSIFLWIVYGILLKNYPIIIANLFSFVQALIILFSKIKNQIKKVTIDKNDEI
jgi:MtN3 and saliva related transmembrane protein